MRTVFLGTSAFAAVVLEGLLERGERPELVLTRPDRPRGRGRRLAAPPVADAARRHELELAQPADVNGPDTLARVLALDPEAICVCAFGALIREPLLSARTMLNVHPSLLPRWRGAAPVERAIMAGDQLTGVSIMRVTAGLDSGPVCLAGEVAIGPRDTYGDLAGRLAPLGSELLVRALREAPPFAEQTESEATYAEKIMAADRRLDPGAPAVVLDRVVRALAPHIGARLERDGFLLGVHRARPAVLDPAPPPGAWVEDAGGLYLGTADGALELELVQPPGGRSMTGGDFARGHRELLL